MSKKHDTPAAAELRRRIGSNARRLREDAGLSQQACAERAGLAVRHLQKIERGSVNLTINTLIAIAEALGVDLQALIAISSEP